MKKFIVTVLILAVLGAGGYGVYHHFFEKKANEEERISSSDAENAVYVDKVSVITGYGSGNGLIDRYGGEVEPQATLQVKLEGDRTVEKCFVKEGDQVTEGQRLFVYDTRDEEDKLTQAEIDIEKDKGDIEIAKKAIEQYEKEKKSASADDQLTYTTNILQEQNDIKQYEYNIKSNELEMQKLKETIDNATVKADMAGVVQKISDPDQSDSYSYGSSSESVYITILADGDFRVKGTVNEQNIQNLEVGMPMIVHSRVDENAFWRGTLSEIKTDNKEEDNSNSYFGGEGGSGSSNYTFYVELEGSEGLMLGQHVYMEEDKGQTEKREGLWLADYYIVEEGETSFVWLANKSNKLEKRILKLGEYDEELMEYQIQDGLDPEDYIAFPQDNLEEGLPVIYNDFGIADAFAGNIPDQEGDLEMFDDENGTFGVVDFEDGEVGEDWDSVDWDDEEVFDEDLDEDWDEEDWDDEDWDEEDWDDSIEDLDPSEQG